MKLVSQHVQQAAENDVTLKPLLVSLDETLAELNIKKMACQVGILTYLISPMDHRLWSLRYDPCHIGIISNISLFKLK